jgi:hypothetical protein
MGEASRTSTTFRKALPGVDPAGRPGEDLCRATDLPVEEYLSIPELADRLKFSPKTIQNKMAAGIFKRGVHYFRPQGTAPRFKWSAIVAWLEEAEGDSANAGARAIPMARGYALK